MPIAGKSPNGKASCAGRSGLGNLTPTIGRPAGVIGNLKPGCPASVSSIRFPVSDALRSAKLIAGSIEWERTGVCESFLDRIRSEKPTAFQCLVNCYGLIWECMGMVAADGFEPPTKGL